MTEVDKFQWARETQMSVVSRRAGGRRRHNALRQFRAEYRRTLLVREIERAGGIAHRIQAQIAKTLGVSESTISRDIKRVFRTLSVCPTCRTIRHQDDTNTRLKVRTPGGLSISEMF